MQDIVAFANNIWGLWLLLVFLGVLVWTLWPGRAAEMEHNRRIPLDDEDDGHADKT